MSDFYKNFKELCSKYGVTQSKVMTDIGLTRGAASCWAKGKEPKESSVKAIADYFGVNYKSLYEGIDNEKNEPISLQALGAMVLMPVIGSVKAGYGLSAEESYTGEYLSVSVDAVHNNPSAYRLLNCKGDSMYPFILENDKLLVSTEDVFPVNGQIYVFIIGDTGDGTVKKLHIDENGTMQLISMNPLYPPMIMKPNDRIYGKVVRVERSL